MCSCEISHIHKDNQFVIFQGAPQEYTLQKYVANMV